MKTYQIGELYKISGEPRAPLLYITRVHDYLVDFDTLQYIERSWVDRTMILVSCVFVKGSNEL